MDNTDAALPAYNKVEGTPEQMHEKIARAIPHPHDLSLTYVDSQQEVAGHLTHLQLGQGDKETKARITLSDGTRILIYVPCDGISSDIIAFSFHGGPTDRELRQS